MYKVYFLDGYEITDVEDVQFGHERGVKVHNGLGQGNFPIAEDKQLKTWSVKCTQEDTSLFEILEKMLNSKEADRLVITSDSESMSEPVLLKGYERSEISSGVYDVTVEFLEYKPVSVKTTNIPYIKRPGKVPTLPKVVVFQKKGNTPYIVSKKNQDILDKSRAEHNEAEKNRVIALDPSTYANVKTGKPINNPCLLEKDKEYKITMETPIFDSISAYFKASKENEWKIFVPAGSINKAYTAMQKAKDEAKKRIKGGN